MKKMFRTYDAFDSVAMRYFEDCKRKAKVFHIFHYAVINNDERILILSGNKIQFIKYYCTTLLKWHRKIDGIRRLISVIFW